MTRPLPMRLKRKPRKARKVRSCGKRRFRDHAEAIAALRLLSTSSRGRPVRAYDCPKCGGWHLTSQA